MKLTLTLLMSLILWAPNLAEAQAQTHPPEPAFGPVSDFDAGQGQAIDDQAVPTPFTSLSQSLAFSGELERSNYLNGGITLSSTFDDNALNTSTGQVSNIGYSIIPNIGLRQNISRLQLGLNYSGGFTINQRLSDRNQGTHAANADLRYRLSPHVDFRLRDNFFLSTGFLNQLNQGDIPGPPGMPNQTVITPLSNQKNNDVTVETSYRFRPGDVVGLGGTYYFSNFDNTSGGSQLQNTRMARGMAFYNHRISPKNWLGANYSAQSYSFSPSSDKTFVNSVQGSLTMLLKPNMQLVAFGGAQFSHTTTHFLLFPISFDQVTPLEGANFTWNGQRTSSTVQAWHRVSDGGGLQAAVQSSMVEASIRRQFLRRTGMEFTFTYSSNNPLTRNSGMSAYELFSGGVSVDHQLMQHVSLRVGYARDYQDQSTASINNTVANHNRAWISLSYGFERPLGR